MADAVPTLTRLAASRIALADPSAGSGQALPRLRRLAADTIRAQPAEYRESVLPPRIRARVAVEAVAEAALRMAA